MLNFNIVIKDFQSKVKNLDSELLESFFSDYATIQSSYTTFFRNSLNTIKLKIINLDYENDLDDALKADFLASFATDILIANKICGESCFSIQDLVDDVDGEFVILFNSLSKKLAPTIDPFQDTEILTPDIFHVLGERLIRDEILDSGAIFTPPGVVRLLTIQALYHYFGKNTSLDKEVIIELLVNPTSFPTRKLKKNEIESISALICNIRILDPACGTGAFYFEIVEALYSIQKCIKPSGKRQTRTEIFRDNVYGFDVNPKIMFKLRIIIRLWLMMYEETALDLSFLYDNFKCSDSLLRNYSMELKYDIIIGNPPYVRQENIRSQSETGHGYKEKIINKFPINKRSDLYIYFFYLGLSRLKENGILSFLTSSSWLNIGFGFEFQDYLLQHTNVLSITDFDYKAFSSAEINTVITTLSKYSDKREREISQFISLKSHITKENVTEILQELYRDLPTLNKNSPVEERKTQEFLIRLIDQNDIEAGTRWGNEMLLAPPIYFKLKKHLGRSLVRLGDIAFITRGITTGLNKFFILEKISENKGIATVRNRFDYEFNIELEFLQPFLIGPKRMLNPIVDENELRHFILLLPENFKERGNSLAAKYIEYGKNKEIEQTKGKNKGNSLIGAQNVPTLAGKNKFYTISLPQTSRGTHIFIQKIFSSKYKIYFTLKENEVWANNTFYNINLKPEFEQHSSLILGSLLSSLTYLSIELNGRRSFGMGALDTATFDIENIMIIDPCQIQDFLIRKQIEKCVKSISSRQFLEVKDEFEMDDRNELDKIILNHLNLAEYQQDLYESVENLVHQRISKSRTHKKN